MDAKFPPLKFLVTGPKLTARDLRVCSVPLTSDLERFLILRNGGVPTSNAFRFNFRGKKNTLARVRYFNGLNIDARTSVFDDIARLVVCSGGHMIPVGGIPIGEVEISGEEFDGCTLLTFGSDCRNKSGRVYFFDNRHDAGDYKPNDGSKLTLLASSLPAFMRGLRPYDNFHFRIVYKMQCAPNDLETIEETFVEAGSPKFVGEPYAKTKVYRYAVWPKMGTVLYLTAGMKTIATIPLPKEASSKDCHFSINVNDKNHQTVVRLVARILKSLPAWKGALEIGTTPVMR
ncbi:MAG: hypothetical protein ACK5OC_10030 [Pirellula sp.]